MTLPARGDFLAYVMDVYDHAQDAADLQTTVDDLTRTNAALLDQHTADAALHTADLAQHAEDVATIARLQAIIDGEPDDPPPPPPPPVTTALIGLSSDSFDPQQKLVEATGGKLQAARRFDDGKGVAGLKVTCPPAAAKGLVLITSCKPGDWGSAASGAKDAEWKAQAAFLASLKVTVWGTQNHEPGKKSLGDPLVGEGGTAAEFAAMQSRCCDIYHAAGLNYCVIMNGWQFDTGRAGALTDAQWDVWLPPSLRTKLDVIAADHYEIKAGGEDPTAQFLKHVARCKAWGKPWGIGEFNAYDAPMIANIGKAAKDNAATGAFACLWATRDYTFTSGPRLAAAQAIVKGW